MSRKLNNILIILLGFKMPTKYNHFNSAMRTEPKSSSVYNTYTVNLKYLSRHAKHVATANR